MRPLLGREKIRGGGRALPPLTTTMHKLALLLFLLPSLALLGACGSGEEAHAAGDGEEASTTDHGHAEGDDHGHDHADGEAHDHDHGDAAETGEFTMPSGGRVFFVAPEDGATVSSPLTVVFGAEDLEIVKAGVMQADTGHHHIIIDGEPVEEGMTVPTDDQHIHFGDGQTEAEIELPPGEHTLTMQLADGAHRSYGAAYSATITVTVE